MLAHIDTFDPERASFWTFTKLWADFVLRRHRTENARRRARELPDSDSGADPFVAADAVPAPFAAPLPPDATARLTTARCYRELLDAAFSCRRLPHEILCFALVKLCEWTPQDVVVRLWDRPLRDHLDAVVRNENVGALAEAARAPLAALRQRLAQPVGAGRLDARILRPIGDVAQRIAAETTLADYDTGVRDHERAVVRWWSAVDRVVRADLLRREHGPVAEWLHHRGSRRGTARAAAAAPEVAS